MKLTTRQFEIRNRIMGHDTAPDHVGFTDMTVEQLNELIQEGLADLDETQNDSPSISQFLDFMTKWPSARAHGYTIGSSRSDARVSIEGLRVPKADVTMELLKEFASLFHGADEFNVDDDLYCWWD